MWIEGIEVIPEAPEGASQFWFYSSEQVSNDIAGRTDPKSFVLPFSPNLNCLIGGRGSGKSAILEVIKFLLPDKEQDEDEFNREFKKTPDKQND